MSKEDSSFGKSLSKFIIVISAVGIGLRLLFKGLIDVEILAIFFVLVVIAAAIDSVWIKLILACAGIGFFLLDFTNYNMTQFQAIAASVGALLLVLFGIYVMTRFETIIKVFNALNAKVSFSVELLNQTVKLP